MNENVIILTEPTHRDVESIPCPCGGFADRVKCTPEEIKEHNCGRSYECCSRAFVCRICKKRLIGQAFAPEVEGFYDFNDDNYN